MLKIIRNGFSDLGAGMQRRAVWMALAREDIDDQHRRTSLGPFWLLINYLAFAGTFIFLFRVSDAPEYPTYVATGLLVWFYIQETITLSVTLFAREENFIKGTTLPLSVYVMRLAAQSAIRGFYALAGCVAVLLLSNVTIDMGWVWALLGVGIILVVTPAAIIAFAFLGTFFPDSQFVVANIMRVGMFLTPVLWTHGNEGGIRGAFYALNPFTYFLEIVRVPILDGHMPLHSLLICVIIGLGLWALALVLLGAFRRRVVFLL